MSRAPRIGAAALVALALSVAIETSARAKLTQPITDDSLLTDMKDAPESLPTDPGAVCTRLDEVYFAALRREDDRTRPKVSGEFATELQSLALLRARKHCTKCQKGASCRKVASADALADTHARLVTDLGSCTPPACGRLRASLLKNFIDLVRESPADSAKVAQAARQMVLVVSADEIAKIMSREDLIRLGEIAKLAQDLKDPARWKSLRESIDILTQIYPELRHEFELHPPPVEPQSREEYLHSLATVMNVAQLIELNRLRAAQHGVRLTPESEPQQKILIVVWNLDGCEAGSQAPDCLLAADVREGFLIALGATADDGVALAKIPGAPEDVLRLATEALTSKKDEACDPNIYGSLCERPYAGVALLSLRREGAVVKARVGWRVKNELGKVNDGGPWDAPLVDRVHARKAGFDEGVEVLRDQTLWKVVSKEPPAAAPVIVDAGHEPEVVLTSPRLWPRLELTSTALFNAGLPLLLDDSPRNDRLGAGLAVADALALGAMAAAFWQARAQREAFERGETSSLHGADEMYGLAVSAALVYVGIKAAGLVGGFVLQKRKESR